MEAAELVQQLVELAEAAGFVVRPVRGSPVGEGGPSGSGVCRVQGAIWVMLADGDALADQIDVLVRALQAHAPEFLENQYLPPAVRERFRGSGEPG